jgi:hypothetical protein
MEGEIDDKGGMITGERYYMSAHDTFLPSRDVRYRDGISVTADIELKRRNGADDPKRPGSIVN